MWVNKPLGATSPLTCYQLTQVNLEKNASLQCGATFVGKPRQVFARRGASLGPRLLPGRRFRLSQEGPVFD